MIFGAVTLAVLCMVQLPMHVQRQNFRDKKFSPLDNRPAFCYYNKAL